MFKRLFDKILPFLDLWKNLIIGIVLLFLFMVFVSFAERNNKKELCRGIKVNLLNQSKDNFITEDEVINLINIDAGEDIIYQYRNKINLLALENFLNTNNYIEKADLYFDMKGVLYADLMLRTPIIRVFSNNSKTYYIDENAKRMPVSNKHTTKILVATGYIEDTNPLLQIDKQLFELADYIQKDIFLRSLIGQVYVKKDTEVLLIPKIGDLIIDFGTPSDMKVKFEKLKIFFKSILPYEGWNKYSKVTLKYKNQIIVNNR
jgi:cell division protein FtsQ